MSISPQNRLRKLTFAAIFTALSIVLTRFLSIQFPFFRLGIGMAPVHLSGYLLGPVWGGVTGLLADLIGLTLNPIGTPNLGITLTTTLHGILAGVIMRLCGRKMTPGVVVLSGLVTSIVCSWLMMSFFLGAMYGEGFVALLFTRGVGVFVQGCVLMLIETLMIPIFCRIRRFLPGDTRICRSGRADADKYDKLSEKSFKTRR